MIPAHKCLLLPLAVASVVGACGGDDDAPGDGGPTEAGEDAGLPVAAPPMPPSLLPCPPGWREVNVEGDPTTCDPYPEGGPSACASHEAHFPGGVGCETVGAPCPAGDFAEGLSGDVVYVLATAAVGGDGSLGSPFQTPSDIPAASLGPGVMVALGRGSYDAAIALPAGVTLQGSCAAETIISSSEASPLAGVVTAGGAGVHVRDVTIGPSARPGLWVNPASDLTAEGLVISGRIPSAIVVDAGGTLTARELAVRDVQSRGLQVGVGGSAQVARAVFERTSEVAILVSGGATLRLEDTLVRETTALSAEDPSSVGLKVGEAGTALVERSCFENAQSHGVLSEGVGWDLEFRDVVIRDGPHGASFALSNGTLHLDRVLSEGNGWGMAVVASIVTASDVVVRDSIGNGVLLVDCAIELRRLFAARVRTLGVAVWSPRAGAVSEDLIVRDVESAPGSGAFGRGLSLQVDGSLTLRRALIERTREIGLSVDQMELEAEDVTVSGVRESACSGAICGATGFGVLVSGADSVATLTQFAIREAEACGVYVANEGSLDLAHGVIEDCAIGACVQSDTYDLSRLSNDVRYSRNEINLDARNLPVPESLPPVILPP